jgi:hypothetical protein
MHRAAILELLRAFLDTCFLDFELSPRGCYSAVGKPSRR